MRITRFWAEISCKWNLQLVSKRIRRSTISSRSTSGRFLTLATKTTRLLSVSFRVLGQKAELTTVKARQSLSRQKFRCAPLSKTLWWEVCSSIYPSPRTQLRIKIIRVSSPLTCKGRKLFKIQPRHQSWNNMRRVKSNPKSYWKTLISVSYTHLTLPTKRIV